MRRIGVGALSYLVPTFALGFVWHLVAFKGYYGALATYRHDVIIPFGFLSMTPRPCSSHGSSTAPSLTVERAWAGAASPSPRSALCCRGASRPSPSPRRT